MQPKPVNDTAIEVQRLKSDSFGRISVMRDAGVEFVRRDLSGVAWWLRLPAWWLAQREARALAALQGMEATPRLLRWDGRRLDRSFLFLCFIKMRPP